MAINKKYKIAYSEVFEILKYIPKEELEKIPKDKIEFYRKNKDENYIFKYDVNKSLEEQNVSEIAKGIIIILFRDYFANGSQKEILINKQKEDLRKKEIEKNKLYNKDMFISNLENEHTNTNINTNINLKENNKNKNSFISKLINKIKDFFKGK